MKPIADCLKDLQKRIPPKSTTPEELSRVRLAAMAENTICAPDCPECAGLGYVRNDAGKLELCGRVDPLTLYPLSRYGIEVAEAALTWDAVKNINDGPAAAKAVCGVIERGAGWAYLWGPPGLAKTLVLKIAVTTYLRNRQQAAYVRMAEILDDLRGAFDKTNPSEESQRRLDWWAGLPLLAIDEFDRVNLTEYARERIFLLMDRRYEGAIRGKNITLMASNGNPKSLDGYIYDRINDRRFAVVELKGKSARQGMEWGNGS